MSHTHRTRRLAASYYEIRVASGLDRWSFIAPLPLSVSRELMHDIAIKSPARWEVVAIGYFKTPEGEKYKRWHQYVTPEPIISMGSGLKPLLDVALTTVETAGNDGDLMYESAIIMRQWSQHWPTVAPILRRHHKALMLDDDEIDKIERGE